MPLMAKKIYLYIFIFCYFYIIILHLLVSAFILSLFLCSFYPYGEVCLYYYQRHFLYFSQGCQTWLQAALITHHSNRHNILTSLTATRIICCFRYSGVKQMIQWNITGALSGYTPHDEKS